MSAHGTVQYAAAGHEGMWITAEVSEGALGALGSRTPRAWCGKNIKMKDLLLSFMLNTRQNVHHFQ